jgi:hypothetical protein
MHEKIIVWLNLRATKFSQVYIADLFLLYIYYIEINYTSSLYLNLNYSNHKTVITKLKRIPC